MSADGQSQASILRLDEAKRTRILHAALREFTLRGFSAASTNEIIKGAGISKGLLFHYFGTKQQLFLFLVDYSIEILNAEYFALINTAEPDLFARYRQIALLKLDLIHTYGDLMEFVRVAMHTDVPELRAELERRRDVLQAMTVTKVFDQVDVSRFKQGLDVQRAMQIIEWAVAGFSARAELQLQGVPLAAVDYTAWLEDFDAYLALLQASFYD